MSYNPIGRTIEAVLVFPVTGDSFEVLDEDGNTIQSQVCGIYTNILGPHCMSSSVV